MFLHVRVIQSGLCDVDGGAGEALTFTLRTRGWRSGVLGMVMQGVSVEAHRICPFRAVKAIQPHGTVGVTHDNLDSCNTAFTAE